MASRKSRPPDVSTAPLGSHLGEDAVPVATDRMVEAMPVALTPGFLERFLPELNADELKVYLHLGASAKPRSWVSLPEPPRFTAEKSSDAAADQKRFRAALQGLRLKDLVEVDAEQRYRLPHQTPQGTFEAERQYPSGKERAELWQELQEELYGAVRSGPTRQGFLAMLEIVTRYVPRLDDGVQALHREGGDRSGALFDQLAEADRRRAIEKVESLLGGAGDMERDVLVGAARKLIEHEALPPSIVWEAVSAWMTEQAPVKAGPEPMSERELEGAWDEFTARLFSAYVGRTSRANFMRLLQLAFLFATKTLPEGEPEEIFGTLRDRSTDRFQELMDDYLERARDALEADASRTVTDEDLLGGKAWEHAKRLASKHEVPVELVMDHLMARQSEVELRSTSERDDFDVDAFEPPDISGMSKEEGEGAWITAVAKSPTQLRAFNGVLRRLRRAKRGYLERAITAYCRSIIELLDEHGMLENPSDEILDNIVATINEQTAYFRDQYFALTVDPIEPDDVRKVLHNLSDERRQVAKQR